MTVYVTYCGTNICNKRYLTDCASQLFGAILNTYGFLLSLFCHCLHKIVYVIYQNTIFVIYNNLLIMPYNSLEVPIFNNSNPSSYLYSYN